MIKSALFLFVFVLSGNGFAKNNLPDFLSKKQIIKDRKKYLNLLPKKQGYMNAKIWNTLVDYTTKKKDVSALTALLKVYNFDNNLERDYILDLVKIINKEPTFFLKTVNKFYKGEKKCATWLFDLNGLSIDSAILAAATKKKTSRAVSRQITDIQNGNFSKKLDQKCRKLRLGKVLGK